MSQILDRLEDHGVEVMRKPLSRAAAQSSFLSAIVSAHSPVFPDVATDRRYRPSAETSRVSDAAR